MPVLDLSRDVEDEVIIAGRAVRYLRQTFGSREEVRVKESGPLTVRLLHDDEVVVYEHRQRADRRRNGSPRLPSSALLLLRSSLIVDSRLWIVETMARKGECERDTHVKASRELRTALIGRRWADG